MAEKHHRNENNMQSQNQVQVRENWEGREIGGKDMAFLWYSKTETGDLIG